MLAPPAVKVAVAPEQIAPELGMAVNVGSGFTVKLTVLVLTQPLLFVPVTV